MQVKKRQDALGQWLANNPQPLLIPHLTFLATKDKPLAYPISDSPDYCPKPGPVLKQRLEGKDPGDNHQGSSSSTSVLGPSFLLVFLGLKNSPIASLMLRDRVREAPSSVVSRA